MKKGNKINLNIVMLKVILNMAIFVSLFGIALPALISSRETEMVIIGMVILVFTPLLFWNLNKSWILKVLKLERIR